MIVPSLTKTLPPVVSNILPLKLVAIIPTKEIHATNNDGVLYHFLGFSSCGCSSTVASSFFTNSLLSKKANKLKIRGIQLITETIVMTNKAILSFLLSSLSFCKRLMRDSVYKPNAKDNNPSTRNNQNKLFDTE